MMTTTRRTRLSLLVGTALYMCLGNSAQADVYDDLRVKWQTRASSAPALPPNDPDVAMQSDASSGNADLYWSTMDLSVNRTALWPDLPLGTASGSITNSISRLGTLASMYQNASSPHYNDPALLQAILEGIDWIVANHYTATGVGYDNWWDWQIGAPAALNNFMMSFYGQLSPTQLATYVACIDHYTSDPAYRSNMDGTLSTKQETAANRLDKALGAVLRGILAKDGNKIAMGRDAISQALAFVTTGDGFYADGSFVQHNDTPYVGNYGMVMLGATSKLYYILNNSNWPISGDPNYLNPYQWAMNAFRPFIYNGAMMDNQRGRGITRQFSSDHGVGRSAVNALAEMAQALPASQGAEVMSLIKGWVARDGYFGASYFTPVQSNPQGGMSSISAYDIALIKAAVNDSSIPAAEEPEETRYFPAVDRAVSRRNGFAFALSMFSKRMTSYETINGENLYGWWTGVGQTSLYNADQRYYDDNYWATVDMMRQPGTTTDRTGTAPTAGNDRNTKALVGGVELNRQFATAAMDFALTNVSGSPLTGKKAWFMFGDRIVAVGAGISNTNGIATETVVENRKLNSAGDNALTVNSVASVKDSSLSWTEAMPATSWAHLAGNTAAGSDVGYVFPDLPTVTGLREARTGAWSDVSTDPGNNTVQFTNNYLSLALNHGVNPSGAAYTYILLPNRTPQQTADFAAANPIAVIERSTAATAVKDASQGLTGLVFWNDSAKTVNVGGTLYLSSDKRAAAMIQEVGGDLQLAVSDPTQANTGVINLELGRMGNVISADPGITVTQTSPTIKMAINVNGSLGKAYNAHFSVFKKATLSPTADAYVRDGAYAGTNYGSSAVLTIKNDTASGFTRSAVMKFDLSSITGTITSATLKMTPVTVGSARNMVHNLYQTTSDSWTEGAVTWSSAPANGSQLGSWTVPLANTTVAVDVSSAANGVLSGGKILSMAVQGAAAYGSNGNVDYASRENTNAAYRPVLEVTYQ